MLTRGGRALFCKSTMSILAIYQVCQGFKRRRSIIIPNKRRLSRDGDYGQEILARLEAGSPSLAWAPPSNLAFSRSFNFSSAVFCSSVFPSIRTPRLDSFSHPPLLLFLR